MTQIENNKCYVCYEAIEENGSLYHSRCAKKLFGSINVPIVDFKLDEMEALAKQVVLDRLALTGVQRKLSLDFDTLRNKEEPPRLTIVGLWGGFVLKSPVEQYPHMPENEALTMQLAGLCGIEVAAHGLIRLKSGELAYIAKRFDRVKKDRLALEDFCQLTENLTERKYHLSMEKAGKVILKWASNPILDVTRFFDVAIFSFLTGNADMHLKNFSLLTEADGTIRLSPAYDLLATKLLIAEDKEEMALTINGKRANLKRDDFVSLGQNLGISPKAIEKTFTRFALAFGPMKNKLAKSFLPENEAVRYLGLLDERAERLLLETIVL